MEQFGMYNNMLMSPDFILDDSDSDDTLDSLGGDSTTASPPGPSRKRSSKPCKYIPHSEKPVQVVQKRNARERRRVQAVNSAFVKLRKIVPYENKHKRLSKVKTLRTAIDYIRELQQLIQVSDCNQQHPQPAAGYPSASPPYADSTRWMHHSTQQHHYNQDTRVPSYCTNDDSSGQWTSCFSDRALQMPSSHQGENCALQGHMMPQHTGHYSYLQEAPTMYTQRAVAHLASVS